MFDNWLKYALEWLKTPANYFLPILVFSGFGVFAPENLLDTLGIGFWGEQGKPYLGSAFIISASIIGCHYLAVVVEWIRSKYGKFRSIRAAHARLENLTPQEQELLSGYLKENTRTQQFWIKDGVVAGLVHANIIYAAVHQANEDRFPFNIRPWVWDYLKKHPHFVEINHNIKKP